MSPRDPRLPQHQPLAISHRGGNALERARSVLRLGADMLEADIWLHRGRIEVRHMHRLGPILWERWKLAPGWGHQLTLRELLQNVPQDILLFLDLKGDDPQLAPALLRELEQSAPGRVIAACGRNYPQLDQLRDHQHVVLFYSVGEEKEWDEVWPRLEAMRYPALSLRFSLATPQVLSRLHAMGATVVCWSVETPTELASLVEMGLHGATTDNGALIALINERRGGVERA